MGAGIEIFINALHQLQTTVAPFMGAWIEISSLYGCYVLYRVAPCMGAWIEMNHRLTVLMFFYSHSERGA